MKTEVITRHKFSNSDIKELICKYVKEQTGSGIEPHEVNIPGTPNGAWVDVRSDKFK